MIKVLVVEDDPHQRVLFSEELVAAGYEVITATNGKEAVERLGKETPSIVVLDLRMPVMDGLDALGRILAQRNDLPVIIHTAYGSYRDNFQSWSADAFVTKSSDLSELKSTLRRILVERGILKETEKA